MRKRPPPPSTIVDSSASTPSSSSSSSSSSCVVDCDDHNHNLKHNQQNVEEEKPSKPKRARRKRASINSKTAEKCPIANGNPSTARRSSIYRGVTRHRWTGRFEAHLWDKSSWNNIQNKKGRQVYLGAYDSEIDAARTYDLAALKYWGPETTLNFPIENYTKEFQEMQNASKEEYLASLRRRSSGFSRGVSKYRGVARHHHNGRWEARIGRVFGNKYLYLGTFSSQEEAAAAYDRAAIEYRGVNAVTNFDISNYVGRVKNLMPNDQLQPPRWSKTKSMQQQRQQQQQQQQQQEQKIEQDEKKKEQDEQKIEQEEEEVSQCEQEVQQQGWEEIEPQEQKPMPSKFEESMPVSSVDHSSLLVMAPDDDRENPWSFCLDNGGFDPLLVHDIPLEEDNSLLNLFDQTGFEDDIDSIFEGEGNLVGMDETYSVGNDENVGSKTKIKASEYLDNKMVNWSSFSLSSTSSPASTTSLVSCQL